MNTFEKYLEEECWEPEGILDDNMPDAFESWLGELDTQEIMDYAEQYAKYVQYETVSDLQDKLATQTNKLHDELKNFKK